MINKSINYSIQLIIRLLYKFNRILSLVDFWLTSIKKFDNDFHHRVNITCEKKQS